MINAKKANKKEKTKHTQDCANYLCVYTHKKNHSAIQIITTDHCQHSYSRSIWK